MNKWIFLPLILLGCGGGDDSTETTPTSSSTTLICSEVSVVNLEEALAVQEELSQEGGEVQIEFTPDGNLVLVLCGGTYIDNDPTTTNTTTTNDIVSAEDEGDIEINSEGV